jgi:serine/threonine protein kinase
VKEMKIMTGEAYDNHGNWKREAKALRVFNKLQHQHIVKGIGAFQYRGKRFIIMEWADEGDLKKIYRKHPNAHLDLTQERVAQFLQQFRGLANALNRMHDYKVVSTGGSAGLVLSPEQESEEDPISDIEQPPNPRIRISRFRGSNSDASHSRGPELNSGVSGKGSEQPEQRLRDRKVHFEYSAQPNRTENWRHGDLKPDNILSFHEGPPCWLGRLKLADLGRAKQHMDKTGKRKGTGERFSTPPYDPPEIWATLGGGRSRLVDVWAFGCVLLESVIWLLFGIEELETFRERSIRLGSIYWTSDDFHKKTAKLYEPTFDWIDRLLDHDPECRSRTGGSAMRDLILLVKTKLLVLKLPDDSEIPEEGCRINSKNLVEELDVIIAKGKHDPSYLYTGDSRIGIRAPPFAQVSPEEQSKNQFEQFLTDNRNLTAANIAQNRTPAPWLARPHGGSGDRHDSYLHDFDDKWEYLDDSEFALRVLSRPNIKVGQLMPKKSSVLCRRCEQLDWNGPSLEFKEQLPELQRRKKEEKCEFCTMLLRIAEKKPDRDWIEVDRVVSGLRMDTSPGLPSLTVHRLPSKFHCFTCLPCPRLTVDQDQNVPTGDRSSRTQDSSSTQIGFPTIPKGGSPAHFDIIKAWLADCDINHTDTCNTHRTGSYPTRVIDVGTEAIPTLRLVESASLPQSERLRLKYAALSHPWGSSPPHRHFVTTIGNFDSHKKEIPDNLPETLADAVKTTRSLGIRYLWIDSICIKQGRDGDFTQEADRMETVFSSAYCVIAATRAEGSTSGFLQRKSTLEFDAKVGPGEERPKYVCFPDRDSEGKVNGVIFVHDRVDDFDRDVLQGPLNQRAWVFQERALARRSIHFADNQTYWECGEGIRCEALSKMRNPRVGFLGDPNFPTYGLRGSKGGDIVFYEDLYEQYSKLSFSHIEDRPFAINGLEQRLSKAIKEKGGSDLGLWGIFDDYWGRGLLWRRSDDTKRMIKLTKGPNGGDPAPSWSWQGHFGGITFIKPEGHTVKWLHDEVILPWKNAQGSQSGITTASYYGERHLTGKARDFTIPGIQSDSVSIVYDDDGNQGQRRPQKCIVIGRMKVNGLSQKEVRNYVLILARKESAAENVYERIGAGFMKGSFISFDDSGTTVLVE